MTKTLNQIIFFPPPKSEYLFQQHWESEYFFRIKHNPHPLQVKWSFPNISCNEVVKLLGIDIDYQLNFDKHIKNICRKASQQLSVLKRIGCFSFF